MYTVFPFIKESAPYGLLLLNNKVRSGYHDTYIIMVTSQMDNCYTIHITVICQITAKQTPKEICITPKC